MPKFTKNYNLIKPIRIENYNVEVFNANYDTLDNEIFNNKEGIKTNLQQIESIIDSIGGIDNKISSFDEAVSVINEDITVINKNIEQIKNNNNNSNENTEQLQNRVQQLESEVSDKASLNHSHGIASTTDDGFMSSSDKVLLDNLKERVEGLEDNATNPAITVIDDLITGGRNVPLSAEQGKILNNKISNVTSSRINIVDDLTTGGSSSALSAEQGKILKGLYDDCLQLGVNVKENIRNAINSKTTVPDVDNNVTWEELIQAIQNIKEGRGNTTIGDVLAGKTFTNDSGQLLTGTMPNRGGAQTITPTTSNKTLQSGYYSGNITVKGDTNLIANNIRSGVTIFGITGTMESAPPPPPPLEGVPSQAWVYSYNQNSSGISGDDSGNAYFSGYDTLNKLDSATGNLLWSKNLLGGFAGNIKIDSLKGEILCYDMGDSNNNNYGAIIKFNTSGDKIWTTYNTYSYSYFKDIDFDSSGYIYAIDANRIYKIHPTNGSKIWEVNSQSGQELVSICVTPYNEILVGARNGNVELFGIDGSKKGAKTNVISSSARPIIRNIPNGLVIGDSYGTSLSKYDYTLTNKAWTVEPHGSKNISAVFTDHTGNIYTIAGYDNKICKYNTDGVLKWTQNYPSSYETAFGVNKTGEVFIAPLQQVIKYKQI